MSRLEQAFQRLNEEKKKALVFYLTAGDPDLTATRDTLLALADEGVTLCEIGIPFSDPVADGPVIQLASERAINNGVSLSKIWEMTADVRRAKPDFPIVYMTYFNPLVSYGVKEFLQTCKEVGVDGLIIPDLSWEESLQYTSLFKEAGLFKIDFLAPTTSEARMKNIAEKAQGFLYCVSLTGVTGMRDELPPDLSDFLGRIKEYTHIPALVGFGISTPEQAKVLAGQADGIIVGSKVVDLLWQNKGNPTPVCELAKSFLQVL